MSARAAVTQAQMKDSPLGSPLVADGGSQVCAPCCLWTSVPYHGASSQGCWKCCRLLPQSEDSERDREKRNGMGEWKSQSFYNLISEVTFHHFCLFPIHLKQTVSPATHRVEGLYKDANTRVRAHWEFF